MNVQALRRTVVTRTPCVLTLRALMFVAVYEGILVMDKTAQVNV